jgi:hypothetical protein
MTLTHIREQDVAAEHIAVRVVDSDVHPVPKKGVLTEYIPEPWRSNYFLNHEVGERIYYDAPDYAHSYAMRADTFPPDGEFAGSDPEMAFRQVIMEAGVDIAILEPLYAFTRLPEATAALAVAKQCLAGRSLAGQPQQLARAVARVDLRPDRAAGNSRPRNREVGGAPLYGADSDRGRATALVGRPAL